MEQQQAPTALSFALSTSTISSGITSISGGAGRNGQPRHRRRQCADPAAPWTGMVLLDSYRGCD